jgi:endonuclease/exonuclease/phosphatase family metal-dependent hydrolase
VTFYKKDEVTVHSSGTFWLVEGAPTSPKKTSTQNQYRCATWMKCTYKDKKMVLINTHISYKTESGATGDSDEMQALRESEMGVIKTWLSNNYNPSTDGPVVLAGDFNTSQGNSVFTYWRNNNDDCGWYYARDTMYENDKNACDIGRTFNNWVELGGPGQLTIDHQFYSGFSDVKSYLVDREPYAGVQFLSDHWPLTVVYEF